MNVRAFAPAAVSAVLLVISSPYVGRIWAALQALLPDQYHAVVGALLAGAVLAIAGAAVVRIREHRVARFGAIAAGLAIAAAYSYAARTGEPAQDLAERLHFLEYGAVTMLFYFAWRRRGDITTVVFPVYATALTGIADESFQWFVPSRVGELRDVLLNGIAVGCALLIAAAITPPRGFRVPADQRSRRQLAAGATLVVVMLALFVQTVHLGHEVGDPAAGTFRTRFSRESLVSAAAARDAEWRLRAPTPGAEPLLSREDHFLTEAMFHVRRRNDLVGARDPWGAWHENMILERYYEPVLLYGPPTLRWLPEQRAQVASEAAAAVRKPAAYVSDAYPFPIYVWNRLAYWAAVAVIVGLVWAVAFR